MSGARLNTTCETTVSIPEDSDEHQEVIEVQILPQVKKRIVFDNLNHHEMRCALKVARCLTVRVCRDDQSGILG